MSTLEIRDLSVSEAGKVSFTFLLSPDDPATLVLVLCVDGSLAELASRSGIRDDALSRARIRDRMPLECRHDVRGKDVQMKRGQELRLGWEMEVDRLARDPRLLRDGPEGLEILVTVRPRSLRFMGGATVFPGGARTPAPWSNVIANEPKR